MPGVLARWRALRWRCGAEAAAIRGLVAAVVLSRHDPGPTFANQRWGLRVLTVGMVGANHLVVAGFMTFVHPMDMAN